MHSVSKLAALADRRHEVFTVGEEGYKRGGEVAREGADEGGWGKGAVLGFFLSLVDRSRRVGSLVTVLSTVQSSC
eukprot:707787-Rhodomonas_salina.3